MKRALSLLLSLLLAASPVLRQPVYAAGSGTAEDISDDIDAFCAELWETVQEEGEDVIGFPGRVADRLDPDDGGAYYGFYLEETTDISILLSSEYPCYLLLCRNEKPVNIRTLPYNTQKIEETGLPAGYYLLYVIPQPESEGKTNEFSLNLESLMDLDEEPDYSELDLSGKIHNLVSPYWRRPGSDDPDMRQTKNVSGSSLKAGGYLTSWLGPIDEEVMPSGRDQVYADKPTRYMQYAPVLPSVHVQDMSILPRTKADGSDRGWGEYVAHWKNAIMTRGALEVGMFINSGFWCGKTEEEKKKRQYYYAPAGFFEEFPKFKTLTGNHDVTIIGWDDSVPKEYFTVSPSFKRGGITYRGEKAPYTPPGDGAWIIRNSWGDNSHNGGDFYISYYDAFVGSDSDRAVFGQIESNDNYNHLYMNDIGAYNFLGSPVDRELMKGAEHGSASQTFRNQTSGPELLRAVSFGSPFSGYQYKIWAEIDDGKPELLKSGYQEYAGFHTVRLDHGVVVPKGTSFTVYVELILAKGSGRSNYGLFYATMLNKDVKDQVSDIAAYYDGGSETFDDPHYSASSGDFPVIRALMYSDLSDYGGKDVSVVTIANFRFKGSGKTVDVVQKEGASVIYEKGYEMSGTGASGSDGSGSDGEAGSFDDGARIEATSSNMPREGTVVSPAGSTLPEDDTEEEPATAGNYSRKDKTKSGVRSRGTGRKGLFAAASDVRATDGNYREEKVKASVTAASSGDTADLSSETVGTGNDSLGGESTDPVSSGSPEDEDTDGEEEYYTGLDYEEILPDYHDYSGGVISVSLPSSYNLDDLDQVTPVRDQGHTSQCWAFAAIKCVESAVMKNYRRQNSYPKGIRITAENGETIVDNMIDIFLKPGEEKSLVLRPVLSSGNEVNMENETVIWSYEGDTGCIEDTIIRSRNNTPATIFDTAGKAGMVMLTATASSDPALKASVIVRITVDKQAEISIDKFQEYIHSGEYLDIKATVTGASEDDVVWTSDNPSVAVVDQHGRVFALKQGYAIIAARVGNAEASCVIYVDYDREEAKPDASGEREDKDNKDNKEGSSYRQGSSRNEISTGLGIYSSGGFVSVAEGSWGQEADGRWFFTDKASGQRAKGWRYIRNTDGVTRWYKFGEDTLMLTGWTYDPDGRWYYLAAPGDGTELAASGMTGAMLTGWFTDPSDGYRYYLDPATGAMVTGERVIGGLSYTFNANTPGKSGWNYNEAWHGWQYTGGTAAPLGALLH